MGQRLRSKKHGRGWNCSSLEGTSSLAVVWSFLEHLLTVPLRTDWSAFLIYSSFFCVTVSGLSTCASHLTAGCVRNTGLGWGSDGTLAGKVAVSLIDRDVAEVRLKIWQQSKETEYYKRKHGWSSVEWLCQILNNALVQSCNRKGWIIEPCV